MTNNTENLTLKEEYTLCNLLQKVGSKMSYKLFRQLAGLIVFTEVETLMGHTEYYRHEKVSLFEK